MLGSTLYIYITCVFIYIYNWTPIANCTVNIYCRWGTTRPCPPSMPSPWAGSSSSTAPSIQRLDLDLPNSNLFVSTFDLGRRGLCFGPKNDLFSPSQGALIFTPKYTLFAFICSRFVLIIPLYVQFSLNLYSFFLFLLKFFSFFS